jgi:hypothetical protein
LQRASLTTAEAVMSRVRSGPVALLGVLALGPACAEPGEEATPPPGGGLVLEDTAAGRVAGSWTDEADPAPGRVSFDSRALDDGVIDIEIVVDGIALTFLVDRARGVMQVDGYQLDTGEDAALSDRDRARLRATARALDQLGRDVPDALALTRDLASHWSEFPAGGEMQQPIVLPEPDSGASACAYLGSFVRGTHDGWWESSWTDRTTLNGAYLSMHGPCRSMTSEDSQTTWWWTDSWHCFTSEPDHSTSIEYAYGDCLGRCGSGCGSSTVFSWGCLDHDVCNRFGHSWSASLPGGSCADEFTVAAAELVSEPECL